MTATLSASRSRVNRLLTRASQRRFEYGAIRAKGPVLQISDLTPETHGEPRPKAPIAVGESGLLRWQDEASQDPRRPRSPRWSQGERRSRARHQPVELVAQALPAPAGLEAWALTLANNPSAAAARVPAPYVAAANQPMADGPSQSASSPPAAGPLSCPRPKLAVATVKKKG